MGRKGLTISYDRSEMGSQSSAAVTSSGNQHVFDNIEVVVRSWIFNEIPQFG